MKTSRETTTNRHGSFLLTRGEETTEFFCERCTEPKISRTIVKWTDAQGATKTICNDCYGRLASDANR